MSLRAAVEVGKRGLTQGVKQAGFQSLPTEPPLSKTKSNLLRPVVANRFHRTALLGFLAQRLLFGRLGLFLHVGIAAIIVARKVCRRCFPAQITIDALVVDVELASGVFRIFVCNVGHTSKSFRNAGRNPEKFKKQKRRPTSRIGRLCAVIDPMVVVAAALVAAAPASAALEAESRFDFHSGSDWVG